MGKKTTTMNQEPPRKLQFSSEFIQDLRERLDQRRRDQAARPTGPEPSPPICGEIYEEALRTMALEEGLPKQCWDFDNLPGPIPVTFRPA